MWKIAWRNLWRNRTRTIISVTAIALTYGMFLFAIGMNEDMYGQLEDGASKLAGGSVLIHGKGFWDNQTNEFVMPADLPIVDLVKDLPGVDAVAPRVLIDGLLSTSGGSVAVRLQGIEPEAEKHFNDAHKHISTGAFFGEVDPEAAGDPIVLGSKIVDELDLKLGDRVVLTASDPTGEMVRALFHLHGVVHTGMSSMDSGFAFVTVEAAQKALGHDVLTQVGVLAATKDLKPQIVNRLQERSNPPDSLEVLTWQEAMPDMVGMIELDKQFGNLYGIVIFIVVVFAIMNTFLMVVLERIREFGLLGALGLTPRQIATLVLAESTMMAIVALSIGLCLGMFGHFYLSTYGLDMRDIYGDLEMGGVTLSDPVIRSKLNLSRMLWSTVNIFFMILLSSLYPAIKAARLRPAESMRFFH